MRTLLRVLLLAVVPVFVVVAPGAAPSHACSCVDTPVDQLLASGDVVFVGTVLEDPRAAEDGEAAFRVEVRNVYRGVVPEVVQLTTSAEGGACGLDVSEGDRWTFVTTDDLAVGSCDGSAPTTDLSAADVERVLGPGGPPEPGGVAPPSDAEADDPAAQVVTRLFVGLAVVIAGAGAVLLLLMLRAWARNQR